MHLVDLVVKLQREMLKHQQVTKSCMFPMFPWAFGGDLGSGWQAVPSLFCS